LFAEGGALDGIVFVELKGDGSGRFGGFPAPFADGDKLEGNAFFPREARAFAANEEAVANANIGGGEEAAGAIGGHRGNRGVGAVEFELRGGNGRGWQFVR